MPGSDPAQTWVKICGLTNKEDALVAISAGADALGFNLWSKSKRFIPLKENASWIAALPEGVERIAVMVNAPINEAIEVAQSSAFHAVQFHGTENADYLHEFAKSGHRFIIARRLGEDARPSIIGLTDRLLIDAAVPGEFGGTGVTLDLDLAARFVEGASWIRVILAGGLTPENVRTAVMRVQPFGVDVASGVEATPRKKDAEKIRGFVRQARMIDE